MTIIRAKYDYSFYQDDRVSLGVSLGVFVMPLSFSIQTVYIFDEAVDMNPPFPILGLRSEFIITDKIYFKQSVDILYLPIDNFTGSIIDLVFLVGYKPFKHLGFGLGVNGNRMEITAKGKGYPGIDFFGDLKMGYTGVFLIASYSF